jgi:DNA replication licensing factor MCM3
VEVILDQDLVGRVKPGDKIKIFGVFKVIKTESTKTTGIMRTVLIASTIVPLYGN